MMESIDLGSGKLIDGVIDEDDELEYCLNRKYNCPYQGTKKSVKAHLEEDCEKELLRQFIQKKEDALMELKNEVRIRDEELINLKLALYAGPPLDVPRKDSPKRHSRQGSNASQTLSIGSADLPSTGSGGLTNKGSPASQQSGASQFFRSIGDRLKIGRSANDLRKTSQASLSTNSIRSDHEPAHEETTYDTIQEMSIVVGMGAPLQDESIAQEALSKINTLPADEWADATLKRRSSGRDGFVRTALKSPQDSRRSTLVMEPLDLLQFESVS